MLSCIIFNTNSKNILNPMKILIISQYFWPESFRINDLAVSLKLKNHDVTILTGMPSYPNRKHFKGYRVFYPMTEDYQGIKVIRTPLMSRGQGQNWRLLLNYVSFALSASITGLLRIRGKYDRIFVFQLSPITSALPAIVLSKLKNVPVYLWVQDLWPDSLRATGVIKSPKMLNLVGKLVKFIYRHSDHIFLPSNSAIASVQQFGVPLAKVSYLPNWAEDIYKPCPLNTLNVNKYNLPTGFKIMFAGNIAVSQSFSTLIKAAEILKDQQDIYWIIAGDGREAEWVKKEVALRQLSKNFYFLGRKPMDEMPGLFALADCLLVSLTADPIFDLTIPSKLQSYLASAKPILASINGEGARIVNEAKAGLVSPAEDAEMLSKNILSLKNLSPEERQIMGNNGREYYLSHFDREKLVNKIVSLMQSQNSKEALCES